MIDDLEHELRAALRSQAGEVPASAVARVRRRDYRPRTRTLRPPVAAGALVTAVAAAAIVAVVTLGTGTQQAFAGWSATPTPAATGQVTGAEAACQAKLASAPDRRVGVGNPAPVDVAALSPVLTDTRGPFTFVIFAGQSGDTTDSASCITGPSFTALATSSQSGAAPVAADRVTLTASHLRLRSGQEYSYAVGHTGSAVTGVTLVLADGTEVTASTANGWFVAWWPSSEDATAAQLTTAQGTSTQQFPSGACPGQPPANGPAAVCTQGFGGGPGRASGSGEIIGAGAGSAGATSTSGSAGSGS